MAKLGEGNFMNTVLAGIQYGIPNLSYITAAAHERL